MRKNNVRKMKTDKVDTLVIAKTLMMQDSLRFSTLEDLDYIELKELGRFRQEDHETAYPFENSTDFL